MKPDLEIIVYGIPGAQGSKRHVGGGRMIESSSKVKPWRDSVAWAALEARGDREMIKGPLHCRMIFTLPKPNAAPKRKQIWPMRKPDIDKLIRSTCDALTTAGAWEDDARVIDLVAGKRFPTEGQGSLASPGCLIQIWRETTVQLFRKNLTQELGLK
jgi:Holliday junction resolvase RusA-like endonuclease